jgi:hypothetical protein
MHCMSLTPGSTVPPLRSSLHVSSLTPELSRESEGESEGGAFARARERARERERERERGSVCLTAISLRRDWEWRESCEQE